MGNKLFNILTLNKISKTGLECFNENYNISDAQDAPDAVIVRSASMHDMDMPESLKAIARAGAGVNNIPVDACTEKGIVVFNTPGANANAVKEMVLTGLFVSSRKVFPAIEWAKTLKGKGAEVGKLVEKGKSAFAGPEIMGKKLGVIGLGAIGVLVANAAVSLGMEVYGFDPYLSVDGALGLTRKIRRVKNMKDIFTNCDYISIHVPLNDVTKGFINTEAIENMKDEVRILNFSRADLVDDTALIEALNKGKVAAYVTDFPTDSVIGVENVIAIPHLGASTPESEDNCAYMAALEIMDFLENGNIKNSVNLPEIVLPRVNDCRICVIHKNIPNILSPISAEVTKLGFNIENMLSKAKKDYAYTILDVKGEVKENVLDGIKSIDGIIKIWSI